MHFCGGVSIISLKLVEWNLQSYTEPLVRNERGDGGFKSLGSIEGEGTPRQAKPPVTLAKLWTAVCLRVDFTLVLVGF